MKNQIKLISLFVLLIAGCTNNNISSSTQKNSNASASNVSSSKVVNSSSSKESSESSQITSSSSSSLKATEAEIVIEYTYKNGDLINRVNEVGTIGETYNYTVPTINFMEPDVSEISFELTNDGYYQEVIYDYSYEVVETIEKGASYSSFMADTEKGISFNYVISGNDSHWNPIFENEGFIIYNAYLRAKGSSYYADFKSGNAIRSNGANADELLTNYDEEIFVSISINSDSSIDFYKNGLLTYTYVSTMRPASAEYLDKSLEPKYIKDLVSNIFEGINSDGFSIGSEGNYKMKNLVIGYGLNKESALEMYNNQVHIDVLYVDEFGNEILDRRSKIDNKEITYNYTSPKMDNYTCDKESVSGTTLENKKEVVTYTFNGEEKITQEMKDNKTNIHDRTDTYEWASKPWYSIASDLVGDFTIRLNYHLKGAASMFTSQKGSDCCWRTNLTVIHNPENNDRFVHRLDWYGWFDDGNGDGTHIGSNPYYGSSYLDNYDIDTFNVYNDCTITQTIERRGFSIVSKHIIVPNKPGYENMVYHYEVRVQNVKTSKVNISFAAEDSVITFNSIKLLDL